jgi:tRNA-splicing ligase RtcB
MQLIDNIPVWGSPVDEGALRQIRNCARDADHAALMADHHLGYAVSAMTLRAAIRLS